MLLGFVSDFVFDFLGALGALAVNPGVLAVSSYA